MAKPVRDPVCGIMIDSDKTRLRSKDEGNTFHTCSADCRATFDAEPERFTKTRWRDHPHH